MFIEPDEILRSKRKTISIVITSDGKVIVKSPLKLPASEVKRFVTEKQNWIESKLKIINANRQQNQDIIEYRSVLILGKKYPIFKSIYTKGIVFDGDKILVNSNIDGAKLIRHINKLIKKLASEILTSRLNELEKIIKLKAKSIKINGTRGRWGACSSSGNISLNFRVVMLDRRLIDYVIIHELSHLVEMNHSAKFWQVVSLYIPDYMKRRREMKNYNYLLKLY